MMICVQFYKINRMSETGKFNLPKVQFRVKTTANDTIQTQANCTLHKEFGPSVWQERFKMKKEIQESYIRFRRKKKNNYIKQISSTKKYCPNPEDKKMNTVEIKTKIKPSQDRHNFSLEADHQELQIRHTETEQENSNHFLQKLKETVNGPNRELLVASCKPNQPKTNILSRHYSLYDSQMSRELKNQFELKGIRWNCCNPNQTKKLYTQIMKVKSHAKTKNVSGKSSTFNIDGWKPEKITRGVGYLEFQTLQMDY